MDRMKTFFKYALWGILFFIFSEIIINVGLNSSYKNMECKNNIEQVNIEQAQSTLINGRIKGTIANKEDSDISGKYLKIDLYSDNGNLLATEYEEIGNLRTNEVKSFETYFKMQDVKQYEVNIVDEKTEETTSEVFMTEDMKNTGVLLLLTYMIFF